MRENLSAVTGLKEGGPGIPLPGSPPPGLTSAADDRAALENPVVVPAEAVHGGHQVLQVVLIPVPSVRLGLRQLGHGHVPPEVAVEVDKLLPVGRRSTCPGSAPAASR